MKRVKGHSHLYRDDQSGAIINTNDKEYNQRLRTLSHSDSQKDELKKMREDIEIERVKALKAFVKDSLGGKFPGPENSVNVDEQILQEFVKKL